MTKPQIKTLLNEILTEHFGLFESDIKEEKFLEDLGLDSIDKLELTMIIEDRFTLRDQIRDEEVPMKISISDLIELIYNLKN
jgi:acyl carrier protein